MGKDEIEAIKQINDESLAAYGSGSIKLDKDADGRRRFVIENDSHLLMDEFDGGNPFCGIIRVIRKADTSAIWNSYYHGWLTDRAAAHQLATDTVFNFLRRALQQPDATTVSRGPAIFEDTEARLRYVNKNESGGLDCFYGEEQIFYDDDQEPVYRCRYGGGFVNIGEDTGEA